MLINTKSHPLSIQESVRVLCKHYSSTVVDREIFAHVPFVNLVQDTQKLIGDPHYRCMEISKTVSMYNLLARQVPSGKLTQVKKEYKDFNSLINELAGVNLLELGFEIEERKLSNASSPEIESYMPDDGVPDGCVFQIEDL